MKDINIRLWIDGPKPLDEICHSSTEIDSFWLLQAEIALSSLGSYVHIFFS